MENMEDKIKELSMCFELQAPVHIINEIITEMMSIPDSAEHLAHRRKSFDDDYNNMSYTLIDLPNEDIIWNLHVIDTNCSNSSQETAMRIMALTEPGPRSVKTLQVSIAQVDDMPFSDQALKLLCYACLHAAKNAPRKPKILFLKVIFPVNDLVEDCKALGISLVAPKMPQGISPTPNDSPTNQASRQCAFCSTVGRGDLFISCAECDGVVYCSGRCLAADSGSEGSHTKWCLIFKESMETENALADFPFTYADVTTSRTFFEDRKKGFLRERGVFGVGLWQRECQGMDKPQTVQPMEDVDGSVYGLPYEESLLQCDLQQSFCHGAPGTDQPLADWTEYYALRGIPDASIISVLLSFSLTLYHIITSCIPEDFASVHALVQETKQLTVHVIGADKECEMFQPFLECARLLRPLNLCIHLFGNEIPDLGVGAKKERENLVFHVHQGLYHEIDQSAIPKPNLAVCFNGGIGAYPSFMPTINTLLEQGVPLYYSDFGLASMAFSRTALQESRAGVVSRPRLNPFRCPLRIASLEQNLPRYSNAFLTVIKPFCASEDSDASSCYESFYSEMLKLKRSSSNFS